MFRKINLYTVLTFIVYPVFFAGILMFLFFTCSNQKSAALLLEQKVAVDEDWKLNENTVSKDVLHVRDSLYASDSELAIWEPCR